MIFVYSIVYTLSKERYPDLGEIKVLTTLGRLFLSVGWENGPEQGLKTDILVLLSNENTGLVGSVGCAVRLETRRSRIQPPPSRQHSFVEIDHEIFSTVILSLPLIQEGQLSVSGERMCTILANITA